MEIAFHVEKNKFRSILERLKKDEKVSLASIKSRDASLIGKEGYIILIAGLEEYCNKAKEIVGNNGTLLNNEEMEKVKKEVEKEEEEAKKGFGFILG